MKLKDFKVKEFELVSAKDNLPTKELKAFFRDTLSKAMKKINNDLIDNIRSALIAEAKRLIDLPKEWMNDKNIQALPKHTKESLIQQTRGILDWLVSFVDASEEDLK